MNNTNNTQKQIIKELTTTHPAPQKAFKKILDQAKTPEQAEQVKRIARALKIEL